MFTAYSVSHLIKTGNRLKSGRFLVLPQSDKMQNALVASEQVNVDDTHDDEWCQGDKTN